MAMVAQEKRSENTRKVLCDAFRESLLKNGLDATTTESVLMATGLSKGAMYHHFRSKAEIIEAVYRAESHGAIRRAVAAVPENIDPVEQLKQACLAWLAQMDQPEVAAIVLKIGPDALGLARVIEIENEISLKLFEGKLAEAIDAGTVCLEKPAVAARLINAMIGEIAAQRPGERADAAKTIGPVIDAILKSLAVPQ